MREIKFRVFEKSTGKINDWILQFGDLWVLKEGDVVMQFTGLKDKNGKEIYEGDMIKFRIINANNNKDEFLIGNVKFSDGMFILNVENEGCYLIDRRDTEVIGNKFENPELLDANQGEAE